MLADQRSQVRPDMARRFKPCGASGGVLILFRNICALSVMLQVSIKSDREHIPHRALITDEDKIPGPFERPLVGVFHLTFFVQLGLLAWQRDENLEVEESRFGERRA